VTRRRLAPLALGALALLAACAPIDDPSEIITAAPAEAAEENPVADIPDAGKTVDQDLELPAGSTTTTVGYTLPIPEPLPLDAYAPTPEQTVGTIAIPSIGLPEQPLHVGMTLTAINRGPSMWPGTAEPGGVGNLVVAGHRTTYGGPFRDLDLLAPGDTAVFTTDEGTFTYEVEGTEIVDPEAIDIASQTNDHQATLFACHPPGSARQRIVVTFNLLGPDGEPVPRAT
jgi:sortase A